MQPIGEASGEASKDALEKEEEMQYFGEIAKEYLQTPRPSRDTTFGIRERRSLLYR